MKMQILKSFPEIEPFIPYVQQYADNNRKALGFLTRSAYQEQAYNGRLFVAVNSESEYLGHLLFGGRFPWLKVFQVLVRKKFRRDKIGSWLINELITYGEKRSFLSISAKVAADLASNNFWEKSGFQLIRQEKGGETTKRIINYRIKELDTPSLFKLTELDKENGTISPQNIYYEGRPLHSIPAYVIDLNVFFDIAKNRTRKDEASFLISAGFDSHIKFCVTPEFAKELSRTASTNKLDPLLQFAQSLPTLPAIDERSLTPILSELKFIVFPERLSADKITERDISDLKHLASCIHHKVHGFVTSEKALLKAGQDIQQTYGLEVISPVDFNEPATGNTMEPYKIKAVLNNGVLDIKEAKETERESVEQFLISHGINDNVIKSAWYPGTNKFPRRRFCIEVNQRLIGIASWDSPSKYSNETVLYFFIDENFPAALKGIDHILEKVSRDIEIFRMKRVFLMCSNEQIYTKQSALQRGYCQKLGEDGFYSSDGINKILFGGVINSSNWSQFCADFHSLAGLILPSRIPSYEELIHTGVELKFSKSGKRTFIKLFEFETLISPGILISPKREAIILPIRMKYANELLNDFRIQHSLFPSREALLHVEKAYFRKPRNVAIFQKGMLLFFYVSGKNGGNKEVIGMARVTYSDTLSLKEIEVNLSRQGVLSRNELLKLTGSNGKIHVITFDNFNLIPNPVSYKVLKEKNFISKANLVTAEKISFKQVESLVKIAFGIKE